MENMNVRAMPPPHQNWGCLLGGVAFAGSFLAVGLGLFYVGWIGPRRAMDEVEPWIETPCAILESRLRPPNSPAARNTHSVLEIRYRYEFAGNHHESDRIGPWRERDARIELQKKAIQDYPVGKSTVCYVNPADPSQAVLERDHPFNKWLWFGSALFTIAGIAGLIVVVVGSWPRRSAHS